MRKLWDITPFLCTIIGCAYILLGGLPWLIIPAGASVHFHMVTISAILGGFLLTNYSLLFGLLDNQIIQKVTHTDIIARRNEKLKKGIIYALISALAGLYLMLMPCGSTLPGIAIYRFLENAEIVFMAFLIICFFLSAIEMNRLVKAMHNSEGRKTKEEIEDLKQQILGNNIT